MKTCIAVLVAALAVLGIVAQAQTPATTPTSPAPTVQAGAKGSTVKIDGRIFVGIFDSGKDARFGNRSLDIPDAKLRFTFTPSKDITIVNRLSTSRASSTSLDYFYVDLNNWLGGFPGHTLRAGKQKIDIGEETWTDNPVENILITNSAAAVSGYDEGLGFRGPIATGTPINYAFAVLNGTKDFEPSAHGLAWTGKVSAVPAKNLYVSASMYDTGELTRNNALASVDLKVANLQDPPAGATSWSRRVWEADVRWNYGPTGVRPMIVSEPTPRFSAGAAYGQFTDDATGTADREGHYWYVEGLYNVSDRVYVASRLSRVDLDNNVTAKLVDSPIAVNRYRRLSVGLGYRLSPLAHIKAEYTANNTRGGASDPELNQIAVGLATKF